MKKLVIFGIEDFAQLLHYFITHDTDYSIECFTVDGKYIKDSSYLGLPVVPFEKIEENFSPDEFEILLGVGYKRMNEIRQKIFCECKKKGYRIASYVHSSAFLNTPEMGEGNIILEKSIIEPFVKIGNGNLIWCNVTIAHNCVIGDFNALSTVTSLAGHATIKNNCFIGSRSMIFDRVTIQDYTLVGAGANVSKDTKPYDVVVPARSITLENKSSLQMNI